MQTAVERVMTKAPHLSCLQEFQAQMLRVFLQRHHPYSHQLLPAKQQDWQLLATKN